MRCAATSVATTGNSGDSGCDWRRLQTESLSACLSLSDTHSRARSPPQTIATRAGVREALGNRAQVMLQQQRDKDPLPLCTGMNTHTHTHTHTHTQTQTHMEKELRRLRRRQRRRSAAGIVFAAAAAADHHPSLTPTGGQPFSCTYARSLSSVCLAEPFPLSCLLSLCSCVRLSTRWQEDARRQ